MIAKMGIEVNGAEKVIDFDGKVGYEIMNVMVSAPHSLGGGPIPVLFKVYEGDTTILVPLNRLLYFEMTR